MAIYKVKLTESTEGSITIKGLGLLERGVEREIELTETQATSASLPARGIVVKTMKGDIVASISTKEKREATAKKAEAEKKAKAKADAKTKAEIAAKKTGKE
jgi:hypothetical protein